jgi:RND family efflux transporter MFP subunit
MKNYRKMIAISLGLIVVALIVLRLIAVKSTMDAELKAMVTYSAIVPVEVTSAKYIQIERTLEASGVFYPGKEITVLAETTGQLLSLNARVGDYAIRGQQLATVESEVLEQQLRAARLQVEHTKRDLSRFESMAKSDGVTTQQLETAQLSYENAKANLASIEKEKQNTVITSPANGHISERLIETGDYVIRGSHLFTITDQSALLFVFHLSEFEVGKLKKEQAITVFADAYSGEGISGYIKEIAVNAGMAGNYEIRAEVSNAEFLLRAGMGGKALIHLNRTGEALVIPRNCILGSLSHAEVFVVVNDTVNLRKVVVEQAGEDYVVITEGLEEGEPIVQTGHINLEQGTKINVINR